MKSFIYTRGRLSFTSKTTTAAVYHDLISAGECRCEAAYEIPLRITRAI